MKQDELPKVLKDIKDGVLTRADAAVMLDVSERHVNRLMRRYNVIRPSSDIHKARDAAHKRREKKEALTRKVMDGEISHEQAAKLGGMAVRTVYRWINRLENADKLSKNSKKSRKFHVKR